MTVASQHEPQSGLYAFNVSRYFSINALPSALSGSPLKLLTHSLPGENAVRWYIPLLSCRTRKTATYATELSNGHDLSSTTRFWVKTMLNVAGYTPTFSPVAVGSGNPSGLMSDGSAAGALAVVAMGGITLVGGNICSVEALLVPPQPVRTIERTTKTRPASANRARMDHLHRLNFNSPSVAH
jgi:hypothetical protein